MCSFPKRCGAGECGYRRNLIGASGNGSAGDVTATGRRRSGGAAPRPISGRDQFLTLRGLAENSSKYIVISHEVVRDPAGDQRRRAVGESAPGGEAGSRGTGSQALSSARILRRHRSLQRGCRPPLAAAVHWERVGDIASTSRRSALSTQRVIEHRRFYVTQRPLPGLGSRSLPEGGRLQVAAVGCRDHRT
jgi:hypothetical protein